MGGLTSPFCARWRSAWSITTSASIASAIGVARMPTQGSWRPLVIDLGRLALRGRSMSRGRADRAGRLDRDRDRRGPGRCRCRRARRRRCWSRSPRGVSSSPCVGAALRDAGEAGADLDALDRVDAHHRVGDVGVELVEERLAQARPARRGAMTPMRAPQRVARLAQLVHVGLELRRRRARWREERVVRHVRPSSRTGSRSSPICCMQPRNAVPYCCAQPLLGDRAGGRPSAPSAAPTRGRRRAGRAGRTCCR